jgi:hypothetical protein
MKKGIQLDIGEDNEVHVINDSQLQDYCLAGMTCQHANRSINEGLTSIVCHFKDGKQINVFTLDRCPAKFWQRFVDVRGQHDLERAWFKTGCYSCGCKTQWRVKNGRNDTKWICNDCHPPDLFTKDEIETRNYQPTNRREENEPKS